MAICGARAAGGDASRRIRKCRVAGSLRNAALADPKNKARLTDVGGDVLALSPADLGRLIADETEKWGKVIRTANIKPD